MCAGKKPRTLAVRARDGTPGNLQTTGLKARWPRGEMNFTYYVMLRFFRFN